MIEQVVWIVARNDEFYIGMAIQSVIDHAYVYVLDTGSTDGTSNLVKDFCNKYPGRIFLEEKPFGTVGKRFPPNYIEADVRNYALDRALEIFKVDWFIQLDADEIVNDRYWEVLEDAKKSGEHSFGYATNILTTPFTVSSDECMFQDWSNKYRLFDPHVRVWSTKVPIRWVQRTPNDIIHVIPKVVGREEDLYHGYVTLDNVHFHLHRSFGPKSIWHYLIGHVGMSGRDAAKKLGLYYDEMFYNQESIQERYPQYFDSLGKFIPPYERNYEWYKKCLKVTHPIPNYVVECWEKWGTYHAV